MKMLRTAFALLCMSSCVAGGCTKCEITPEMINCNGCRVDGVKTVFCSSLCEIRKCAVGKKYGTCGDCAGCDSCEKLGMITKNSADALKNLKSL